MAVSLFFVGAQQVSKGASLEERLAGDYQEGERLQILQRLIDQAPQAKKKLAQEQLKMLERKAISLVPNGEASHALPPSRISFDFNASFEIKGKLAKTMVMAVVKEDGYCSIYFRGRHSKVTTEVFVKAANAINSYPCKQTLVKLNSPGGAVIEGITVGLIIRHHGWDTVAWSAANAGKPACASSCAFTYLGGEIRYEPTEDHSFDAGQVFFHQAGATRDGEYVCDDSPQTLNSLLIYEYFKYVVPDAAIMALGKVLNESCKNIGRSDTVDRNEYLHDQIYNSFYLTEVYTAFQ